MAGQQELDGRTIYTLIGGQITFDRIVERFYEGVVTDPLLRPMYPEDLTAGKRHLALFLAQYFGGPSTYSEERGHPRLRMRHFPFAIGLAERDAWMGHMRAALEAETLAPDVRAALVEYFERAATFMINR